MAKSNPNPESNPATSSTQVNPLDPGVSYAQVVAAIPVGMTVREYLEQLVPPIEPAYLIDWLEYEINLWKQLNGL